MQTTAGKLSAEALTASANILVRVADVTLASVISIGDCEIPALLLQHPLLMICICAVQVQYSAQQAFGKNVSNSGNPALAFVWCLNTASTIRSFLSVGEEFHVALSGVSKRICSQSPD